MRWLLFCAIGVALLAAGAVAVVQEHDDDRDQIVIRRVRAAWRLSDVSRDGRTLRVIYETSGCRHADASSVVRESRRAVRVSLYQGRDFGLKPRSQVACTLDISAAALRVRLHHPLNGRLLLGASRLIRALRSSRVLKARDRLLVVAVPRVIGLSAGDAINLLLEQRFRPRVRVVGRGAVSAQRPAPGTGVRVRRLSGPFATVTITAGR